MLLEPSPWQVGRWDTATTTWTEEDIQEVTIEKMAEGSEKRSIVVKFHTRCTILRTKLIMQQFCKLYGAALKPARVGVRPRAVARDIRLN